MSIGDCLLLIYLCGAKLVKPGLIVSDKLELLNHIISISELKTKYKKLQEELLGIYYDIQKKYDNEYYRDHFLKFEFGLKFDLCKEDFTNFKNELKKLSTKADKNKILETVQIPRYGPIYKPGTHAKYRIVLRDKPRISGHTLNNITFEKHESMCLQHKIIDLLLEPLARTRAESLTSTSSQYRPAHYNNDNIQDNFEIVIEKANECQDNILRVFFPGKEEKIKKEILRQIELNVLKPKKANTFDSDTNIKKKGVGLEIDVEELVKKDKEYEYKLCVIYWIHSTTYCVNTDKQFKSKKITKEIGWENFMDNYNNYFYVNSSHIKRRIKISFNYAIFKK